MSDEPNKRDEIAALRAEVEALKSALAGKEDKPPPKSTFIPETDEQHRDRMHRMRERRMNFASNFHPDDLRAMAAACPTSSIKDIVAHGTVQSPRGLATETATARPAPPPSATPGFVEPRPLTNPPGTNWVDAIAIADDMRQRAERKPVMKVSSGAD
jgi:hypothetical protein